jgi:hypothetical protein
MAVSNPDLNRGYPFEEIAIQRSSSTPRMTADAPTLTQSMNESDGCAGASLDRVVCDNQRCSAKDGRDRDDDD